MLTTVHLVSQCKNHGVISDSSLSPNPLTFISKSCWLCLQRTFIISLSPCYHLSASPYLSDQTQDGQRASLLFPQSLMAKQQPKYSFRRTGLIVSLPCLLEWNIYFLDGLRGFSRPAHPPLWFRLLPLLLHALCSAHWIFLFSYFRNTSHSGLLPSKCSFPVSSHYQPLLTQGTI